MSTSSSHFVTNTRLPPRSFIYLRNGQEQVPHSQRRGAHVTGLLAQWSAFHRIRETSLLIDAELSRVAEAASPEIPNVHNQATTSPKTPAWKKPSGIRHDLDQHQKRAPSPNHDVLPSQPPHKQPRIRLPGASPPSESKPTRRKDDNL